MGIFTGHKRIRKNNQRLLSWLSWHKWVGVVFSIVIILFCISGIILNHRHFFSNCEVSRAWLPEAYQIHDWNQGVIKGTIRVSGGSRGFQGVSGGFKGFQEVSGGLIAYGLAGVWLTDRQFREWRPLNDGLPEGIDGRKVSGVVQTNDGTLWCAALFDAYRFDINNRRWQKVDLQGNTSKGLSSEDERLSDITLRGGDTIIVASRSALYEAIGPQYEFRRIVLRTPKELRRNSEGKVEGNNTEVTLFKTVWWLHSGQLFGTAGRLVVDFLGVVLIILCLTGIVFFILGYTHRFNVRILSTRVHGRIMAWNMKWHNRFGAYLIVLTVLLAVTGMCLRPPLMVPLVLNKTAPIPGTTLDTDNAFQDKIRAIRWDDRLHVWLMSTSEGFYQIEDVKLETEDSGAANGSGLVTAVPVKVEGTPKVSPMGITVFQRNPEDSTEWLIGSFEGLKRWNPQTGKVTEWFDDAPPPSPIPSTTGHLVTGFSNDIAKDSLHSKGLTGDEPVVFEYSTAPCYTSGCEREDLPEMPQVLSSQPISLWNFALEIHTGRMYEPVLGSILSILFVFFSGLLVTLTLISGYIVYRRSHKKTDR